MRFKELSTEQKKEVGEIYINNSNKSYAEIEVARKFKTSTRSARNWFKRLGVVGETSIESIEVIDPEVVGVKAHQAKILVFDIETAPVKGYVWGMWQQNLGHNYKNQVISDWYMLSWSAKWLYESKVMGDVVTPEESLAEDDTRIAKSLWELVDEADIVVAHNLIKFDERKINTRFLLAGLPKPSPYHRIDTLVHARKRLAFSSNRLDDLGVLLGVGEKMETGGFELWVACREGNPEALDKMLRYNSRDITLLEDVYLALRPYIQPHPNVGLFITEDVEACPTCGSEDLEPAGTYMTSVNLYESVRCTGCGSIGRQRKGKFSSKDKSNLLSPAAR